MKEEEKEEYFSTSDFCMPWVFNGIFIAVILILLLVAVLLIGIVFGWVHVPFGVKFNLIQISWW